MGRPFCIGLLLLVAMWHRAGAQEPPLVEYGPDFYGQEGGPNQTWRWLPETGTVRLRNCQRDMILRIRGYVPEVTIAQGAVLTIQLNGETLDKFAPPKGIFQKEFAIATAQQGADDWAELRFSVDRTVTPSERAKGSGDGRVLGFKLYELTWELATARQPVEFGTGFFDREKNRDTLWRWMLADGVARLWNTRRDMRLKIVGRPPEETMAQGVTVTIQLNGEVLEQFQPQTTFTKEYAIPAARQTAERWSELRFGVDRTAVPSDYNKNSKDTRALGLKVYDVAWEIETFEPQPAPPPLPAPAVPVRRSRWLVAGLAAMALLLLAGGATWWARRRGAKNNSRFIV